MSEYRLNVVIREASVEAHPDGSVTGVVFWNAGKQSFPDSDWNDFVVIVLAWWVKGVARLLTETSGSEAMHFMDGPYKVVFTTTDGVLACQFVDRHHEERVLGSYTTTLDGLCSTILDAANALLSVCRRQEIWNGDVESLNEEARHLRRTLRDRGR